LRSVIAQTKSGQQQPASQSAEAASSSSPNAKPTEASNSNTVSATDKSYAGGWFEPLTLINVGLLIVIAIQAYIDRKQLKVMKDSLAIGTRAYVGVHGIEADWGNGILYLTIENTGHIPADHIDISVLAEVIFPISHDKAQTFPHDFNCQFYQAKLFPGTLKIKVRVPLDKVDEYLPLNPEEVILRVAGHISYQNGFGDDGCDFELTHWNAKEGWVVFPVLPPEEWAKLREQEKTSNENPN
jgi:hypothetical protein